jgi:hypothetical protein
MGPLRSLIILKFNSFLGVRCLVSVFRCQSNSS